MDRTEVILSCSRTLPMEPNTCCLHEDCKQIEIEEEEID